jgi:hypothetical protein
VAEAEAVVDVLVVDVVEWMVEVVNVVEWVAEVVVEDDSGPTESTKVTTE